MCLSVCLSTFTLELQATKRHVNGSLVFSATSARKIMWPIWLKPLRFGRETRTAVDHVSWPNPSISAVRMRIYYTRLLDWLGPRGSTARSLALLLQVSLACFRTVLSATRVCSYIPHGSCCRGCVSQLLARAAPVAYTNRVCAEGLHFSAFHYTLTTLVE